MKLLRLLETATYRRVGGLDTLPSDFRLVAATHRDLRAMVQDGGFRRDLYYRINVFPIRTPALHERSSDVPLLAASLLERVDHQPGRHFTPDALAWLAGRHYPGNIRELRNLIERATLMVDQQAIDADDLRLVAELDRQADAEAPPDPQHFSLGEIVPLDRLEQSYVQWAVAGGGEDLPRVAEKLGISVRTLYRKLKPDAEDAAAE